jgi:fused signal recognition particle receptor
MFGFRKKGTGNPPEGEKPEQATPPEGKTGWFARLKKGLSKTRSGLTEGLASVVLGARAIDDELLEEIETQLLTADVGVDATQAIIKDLTARVSRKQLKDADGLMAALRENMASLLEPIDRPLVVETANKPFVILMVGINGAGKTTTIGKLASRFKAEGRSVMLAAGDTFRAAAVEQLQTWGTRNDVPVIAQHTGADAASVIYDALAAARARGIDVLIADTAGRLHTQSNLMEELKKITRVMTKLDPDAPHEVMLVLDAGTGQNALSQAQQFGDAVQVSGITLTKLDGTAKGGIIFAIAAKLGIPVRFIGVGEQAEDLRVFGADEFVDALFEN